MRQLFLCWPLLTLLAPADTANTRRLVDGQPAAGPHRGLQLAMQHQGKFEEVLFALTRQ